MIESKIGELIEIQDKVMSNLDHSIDYEVAELLKDGKHYAQYSGWNFCGWVYFDISEQLFVCEIWVYHAIVEILKCMTLEVMMQNVCRAYGND